jgi:hypothetical protein
MSMRNVGPIGAASIVLTPSLTLGLSPLNFSPDPALLVEVEAWRIEEGFRRGGNWLEMSCGSCTNMTFRWWRPSLRGLII